MQRNYLLYPIKVTYTDETHSSSPLKCRQYSKLSCGHVVTLFNSV